MDKQMYLELKAKYTNEAGIVDWTGFNAAKPKGEAKAPKTSKPASSKASAPKQGNGEVVVSKASGYVKPATPAEIRPITPKPQDSKVQALSREANVAALLRSIADLIDGK